MTLQAEEPGGHLLIPIGGPANMDGHKKGWFIDKKNPATTYSPTQFPTQYHRH